MKKRILPLLLALLVLLAGCGGQEIIDAAEQIINAAAQTDAPQETGAPQETAAPAAALDEDGEYTSPEDVALYIHTYGCLPKNFITKDEAKALGWDSRAGNLWDVAPGMSIGGDRFGNYEGLLPDGSYRECDVNYSGGHRGGERLIFSDVGEIYYTADHYESFTQLY